MQRQKGYRRTLNFYRLLFRLSSPYRILVDGNFLATGERLKMEWRRLIPKALQVDASLAHFHVTQCVVAELQALGAPAAEALAAARSLPLLKCRDKHGHGEACSPRECAARLVGQDNAGKWVVVTQDAELRDALRAIPGVPLMLISTNVLILEAPSPASRAAGEEAEGRKSALGASEAQAVRRALKGEAASASAGGGGGGGGSGSSSSGGGARSQPGRKRRKGPSEPNPLSQKRKKMQAAHSASLAAALRGGGAAQEAAKPKRRKH